MSGTMNNAKTILALKYTVYAALLLFLYVAQVTPGLLVIGGVKPLLVVPVAMAIAMFEGEFVGGVYGAAAGLLIDTASVTLFGFNGFFICLFCIIAGLMVIYLLRCNLLGCMLFVAVTLLVRGSIEFLFAYGMWGYESVWKIYLLHTLPGVLYTLVITPLAFRLIRWFHRRFARAIAR